MQRRLQGGRCQGSPQCRQIGEAENWRQLIICSGIFHTVSPCPRSYRMDASSGFSPTYASSRNRTMGVMSSPHSLSQLSTDHISNNTVPAEATTTQQMYREIKYASSTTRAATTKIGEMAKPLQQEPRSYIDSVRENLNNTEASQGVSDPTQPFPKRFGRRNSTMQTDTSASFDDTAVWDKKAVLSLGMSHFLGNQLLLAWRSFHWTIDGGGIRGYSALLIIRALMREIGKIERSYSEKSDTSDGPAKSSYHPLSPTVTAATDSESVEDSKHANAPVTDTSPWLPCHYFDYMAGTSTGG